MANPFYNAQKQQTVPLNNVIEMFKRFRAMGSDPQQVMSLLINRSPKLKGIMNEINKSGLTPMQYANKKANECNISLNPILQQLYDISNQQK